MRDYRWDCLAIVLLALGGFAVASVAGYQANDPPAPRAFPANASVQNPCGAIGAYTAATLIDLVGAAAFVAPLPLLIYGLAILRRSPASTVAWHTVGLIVGLSAAPLLAQRIEVPYWNSPLGAGGLVGAVGLHWLEASFAGVGSYFVLLPMVLVGGLLCFDWLLLGLLPRAKATPLPSSKNAKNTTDVAVAEEEESEEEESGESEEEDADEEESDSEPNVVVAQPNGSHKRPKPPGPAWGQRGELRINRLKNDDLPPAPILPARPTNSSFELPNLDILDELSLVEDDGQEDLIREQARLMEETFATFNMQVKVVQIDMGPVVTQYEIELEPGLRARKVISLSEDLAIALRAPSVRIIAPIPGKNTVGIEVPNQHRAKVTLREVMAKSIGQTASLRLPVYLGKDVKGLPLVVDLAAMPHLLIAGRTGTGKSVCLNTLILSILMSRTPEQVRMLMLDPKMVEMSQYRDVPHLLHPVVTDMKKAEALLGWAVDKMEERYALLAQCGVRHIDGYNKLNYKERLARVGEDVPGLSDQMPYIVVFLDEMADLMMTSAKEVETHIIRLAQKSRAVGIHLVLATQKPTVDVITGLIKSNLPARIAFQVASRVDSMVVLDDRGAEKLLGYGDMLFLSPGVNAMIRAQGTFVSDEEVTRVTEFLAEQGEPQFAQELLELATKSDGPKVNPADRDELYLEAVDVVVREQRGSVSLLQRALGIGYGRAARLIDYMAEDGIVGTYSGSQAREVNYSREQWEDLKESRFAAAG